MSELTMSQRYPGEMLPVVAIPLTQGQVAIIDPEDDVNTKVSRYNWCAFKSKSSKTFYAVRNSPRTNGGRKLLYLHKVITGYEQTDHINRNGLDCRRVNMRPATDAQNRQNFGIRKNNTSGFIGVWWNKVAKCWQASIQVDNNRKHLGVFNSAIDAAYARDKAARKYHGEFAVLNFPDGKHS